VLIVLPRFYGYGRLQKNDGPSAPGIKSVVSTPRCAGRRVNRTLFLLRRRQINKDIPQELKEAVFITEDDKKHTVSVSALPGKSWIKLNERQAAFLADSLSKIVRKWSES
jgi:hypothetical protein